MYRWLSAVLMQVEAQTYVWILKPLSADLWHVSVSRSFSVFVLFFSFLFFSFLSCSTRRSWSAKRAFLHDSLYLYVTFWSQISFLLFLIFKRDPSCSVHHHPEPGFKRMGEDCKSGASCQTSVWPLKMLTMWTLRWDDRIGAASGEVSDYWKRRQSNQHVDLWLPLVAHECFFFVFCTAE